MTYLRSGELNEEHVFEETDKRGGRRQWFRFNDGDGEVRREIVPKHCAVNILDRGT